MNELHSEKIKPVVRECYTNLLIMSTVACYMDDRHDVQLDLCDTQSHL